MIPATQLKVGMTVIYKGELHRVISTHHVTTGRGMGMVQARLKNLRTDTNVENRFRSDERLEKAHLETMEMEYLYSTGDEHYFMNTENYEQMTLSTEMLGDNVKYLLPNVRFTVEVHDNCPVGAVPPKVVEMKIVETAPNLKGATATSSPKPAVLETGLVVNVPPFIEEGETIRVDTVEGKYIERAR